MPRGDLDKRRWLEVGRALGRLGRYNRWWVGDWLLYANRKWGEMYVEAARVTGYEYGSLRNLASMSQKFAFSRRRDNLSWGHHADVAGLTTAEQDHWLDRAVELGLTRQDLRIELRSAKRLAAARSTEDEPIVRERDRWTVRCPKCGDELPIPESAIIAAGSRHRSLRG
jgi:hypothetical protein